MTKPTNPKHYFVLDIVRGLSALLVCANHLRSALFTSYSELSQSNVFDKIFYFLTSLGHQSVIVFFVISGFLIGGTIIKNRDNFKLEDYSLSRLSRLYTVLVPALIFTLFANIYLKAAHPEALGSLYIQWSSGPTLENFSDSVLTFLGNLFFLQNIFFSTFGTNSPLWSLSYEFWYYVIFPLFFIALIRFSKQRLSGLWVLASFGLFFLLPTDAKVGFLIWITGALISIFIKKEYSSLVRFFSLILLTLSLLALKVLPVKNMNSHVQDLLITSTFGFFLAVNLNSVFHNLQKSKILLNTFNFLSNISFTLYLFHFPMVVLLVTGFIGSSPLTPGFTSYLTYILMLATILFMSYLMWFIFERNTLKVKFWLKGLVNSKNDR